MGEAGQVAIQIWERGKDNGYRAWGGEGPLLNEASPSSLGCL